MENKDQPVYPTSIKEWSCVDREMVGVAYKGLTKRELIAAMAMQGILSNATCCQGYSPNEDYARQAVAMADALLSELSKPQP